MMRRASRVLPRRPVSWYARGAGLLTSGSSYSPRLPGSRQWPLRVSSPVTVTGSRRIRTAFPGPSWAPRAQNGPRLAEFDAGCNRVAYHASRAMRSLFTESWQRNVWALTLTVFISFVGFQFFSPFLPLYIRELGVTDPAKIALWWGLQAAVTPGV